MTAWAHRAKRGESSVPYDVRGRTVSPNQWAKMILELQTPRSFP
jgi:hypothetical protein